MLGHDEAWNLLQPVRRAMAHYHKDDLQRGPLFQNWQGLIDFLRVELAAEPLEQMRVLFLDAGNRLIRDELLAQGDVDRCAFSIRRLFTRALDLHAVNLVMVHNHPSGDSSVSKQDIQQTRQIIDAARIFGIGVHDHIIIARDGYTSMRAQGLI